MIKRLLISMFVLFLVACSSDENSFYSGTIEGEEIPILAEVNGAIQNLHVDEGDIVKKGQLMAQIDNRILNAQLKEAGAAVDIARAALEEVKDGTRSQEMDKTLAQLEQNEAKMDNVKVQVSKVDDLLEQKQAKITQIEFQLKSAEETESYQLNQFKRIEALYQSGAAPKSDLDFQKEQLNKASANVNQLKAQLSEMKASYEMTEKDKRTYNTQLKELLANQKILQAQLSLQKEGATDHSITKFSSQLDQAMARKEQIQIQLEKLNITSPVDGIVLRRNISVGEITAANFQLFTLLKKNSRKVKVYVPEANLDLVSLGDEAEIRVDAYPDEVFRGKINKIANEAEFTPKNVQTPDERTKMVFEVEVKLIEDQEKLKPGMPADVYFVNKKE